MSARAYSLGRRSFTGGALLCLVAACSGAARRATMTPVNAADTSLERRAELEVERLHAFFTGWFRGELAARDEVFAEFADVMAPEFEMVTPGGALRPRDALLAALRGAHGAWRDDAGATIEIRGQRATILPGTSYALARYEEWQRLAGAWRGRRSTALLREREGAPHGLEWVHVHETWMPER